MFEVQYNDEMEAEIRRLEAKNRARAAGHPEWDNACAVCGGELTEISVDTCGQCLLKQPFGMS
jgi:hypothetical protein